MLLEKSKGVADEYLIIRQSATQTELGQHQALKSCGKGIAIGFIDRCPRRFNIANQRQKRLGQTIEVPLPDMWLIAVGVAPLMVGVVADMAGVEGLHEAERAVVQRVG